LTKNEKSFIDFKGKVHSSSEKSFIEKLADRYKNIEVLSIKLVNHLAILTKG